MKQIIKRFFYSEDKFQPPYFWITIFCILVVVAVILRFMERSSLSDTLILGMLGFIAGWILLYNQQRKKNE